MYTAAFLALALLQGRVSVVDSYTPPPSVYAASAPVSLIGAAGGAEGALQSLEIEPAALEGKRLAIVTAWGRFAPSPWPLTLRAYFGGAAILLDDRASTLTGGGGTASRWRVTYRVILGASPVYEAATLRTPYQATTSAAGGIVVDVSRAIVVRFTAADPSGGDGRIIQEGMTVELR